MKITCKSLAAFLITGFLMLAFGSVSAPTVHADIKSNLCSGADVTLDAKSCADQKSNIVCDAQGENCKVTNPGGANARINTLIRNIINLLSVIVGIVAVIMIIYGGFRYVTSGGDSGNVTSAKNTVLYAIVGLIIVAFAQIIVKFVLQKAT